MSTAALPRDRPALRRRRALWLLWLALPLAGLGFQIAAKRIADALLGAPWDWALAARALRLPETWVALGCELGGLGAWMVILSEISLGAAFSISALSYVLVIGASWTLFGEPVAALQILGGGAILTGVWLIGRAPGEE
jgi:multidrug transporter EmrE-like cation transporter